MWKHRSPVIFIAALLFAIKTLVHSDAVSLTAMFVFLACHYLDRFFGADRAEVRIAAKLKGYEEEIKSLKNDISRIGLTMGIRGNK